MDRGVASKRKLIGFDAETWQAIDLFSRASGKSFQELADEAFADLLIKHHRPRTLKDALKQSPRREPANENKPQKGPPSIPRAVSKHCQSGGGSSPPQRESAKGEPRCPSLRQGFPFFWLGD